MVKKIVLPFLLFFSFGPLFALPLGNPSEAHLFPSDCEAAKACRCCVFSVGFYGDYVFNRHLKTVTGRHIDYSQMFTNAAYLAFSFRERFILFTALGETKFKFNTSLGPFNAGNPHPRFDFESRAAFSWSLGGRATVYEWKCFSFGLGGQYFACSPPAKILFARANVDAYPDEDSSRDYSEWQLNATLSYRYNAFFVPYVGLKYTRVFWEFHNQTFLITDTLATIPNVKSAKHFGYAIGLTLAPFSCKNIAVTAEGRFGDETAVYINGQLRY